MNVQQACEVLEGLLERDIDGKQELLTAKEFIALNKILLECTVKLDYKVKT